MADRPILFSTPMVRALLAGRKTQTRRTLKFQPAPGISIVRKTIRPLDAEPYHSFERRSVYGNYAGELDIRIKRGDRLWVNEAWRTESPAYDDLAPSEMGGEETILYDADADWKLNKTVGKSRVSIHMTRWASRITLMVTNVRVQRLKDISREDAIAEGLIKMPIAPAIAVEMGCDWGFDGDSRHGSPVRAYSALWNHINGEGAWDANPWVVAYTFSVHLSNIDQIGRAA